METQIYHANSNHKNLEELYSCQKKVNLIPYILLEIKEDIYEKGVTMKRIHASKKLPQKYWKQKLEEMKEK